VEGISYHASGMMLQQVS